MISSNCRLNLVKGKWCDSFERCLPSGPRVSSKYYSPFSTGLPAWSFVPCNKLSTIKLSYLLKYKPDPITHLPKTLCDDFHCQFFYFSAQDFGLHCLKSPDTFQHAPTILDTWGFFIAPKCVIQIHITLSCRLLCTSVCAFVPLTECLSSHFLSRKCLTHTFSSSLNETSCEKSLNISQAS